LYHDYIFLWFSPHQFHSTMTLHISSGGWTISLLVATVQRHSLTPLTWTTLLIYYIQSCVWISKGIFRSSLSPAQSGKACVFTRVAINANLKRPLLSFRHVFQTIFYLRVTLLNTLTIDQHNMVKFMIYKILGNNCTNVMKQRSHISFITDPSTWLLHL
jgi:hypothetical protein